MSNPPVPKRKFDHDEARRLYQEEQLSFAEIGRRLGVGQTSVRRACYKDGMAAMRRPVTDGRPRTFDYERAREMRVGGMTYQAIADMLGTNAEAIRYACKGIGPVIKQPKLRKPKEMVPATAEQESLRRFALLTAHDPPIPPDGSCAICAKPRNTERSAKYAKGCAEIDAFCSTQCARYYHGTSLVVRTPREIRLAAARERGYVTAWAG